MAIEATGSVYTRNTRLLIAGICLFAAAYFFYDGWINKEFQETKSEFDVQFNRYVPIPLMIICIGSAVWGFIGAGKKIVLTDEGLTINDGTMIPFSAMTHIDTREFKEKGHYTIGYEQDGQKKALKLSDRVYDNLGVLKDELVAKTGAKPAGGEEESPT